MWRWAAHAAWRTLILIVGVALCLAGLALLVLPGPGLLVLAAGLAVLSIEFAWARHLLHRAREEIRARRVRRAPPDAPPAPPAPGS